MQMECVHARAGSYPLLAGEAPASASMNSSAYMIGRVVTMVSGAEAARYLKLFSIFAVHFDSRLQAVVCPFVHTYQSFGGQFIPSNCVKLRP